MLRRLLKKSRTKTPDIESIEPKSPQHNRSDFDIDQRQGHNRKESSDSLHFGPDVTYSISTDQSSGPSSHDGNLLTSSSATTHLRRNGNVTESFEQMQTTSEPAWSLVPPDNSARASRHLKLKAELSLAKMKLQQMEDIVNPASCAVGQAIPSNDKEFVGGKGMSPINKDIMGSISYESTVASNNTMPTDGNCDAYAVDDFIQTGISVSTCGILSNYRPIFGPYMYDDEASCVTGMTENTSRLGEMV